jgi:hypothetical protein
VRYTQDPPNLILPTEKTIRHLATREGLDELTELEWDLVWDLLAKAGDAQVAEFDEDQARLEAATYAIVEAETVLKQYPDTNRNEVTRAFEEDYHLMQHQLHHVVETLDLREIPGRNHAAKAVRVVKLLRHMKLLWVLHQIDHYVIPAIQRAIEDAIDTVKQLTPSDLAMLQGFGAEAGDDPNRDAEMLAMELQLVGFDAHEIARIARHLDKLAEFERKRARPLSDPNGRDVRQRDNRDMSELSKASQLEFSLPRRMLLRRAAMGELNVRDPQIHRDKKQLLFLVVDGSSSMIFDGAVSASRAAGVLMNRLQAVIDDDAEVFIRFFDGDLRKEEYHAHDATSARELIRVVTDRRLYNGSSTRFDTTLKAAVARVQELLDQQQLREPELVLVTDGHGVIPDVAVLQGIKLHVVQVGPTEVPELAELASRSGGINVSASLSANM